MKKESTLSEWLDIASLVISEGALSIKDDGKITMDEAMKLLSDTLLAIINAYNKQSMNLPNGGDKQVINDANKAPQHHNHYDLSYPFASTERFGEVNPFVFCYGVQDDKNLTFRIKQSLRTKSLKSPLLQNLKKSLDFYVVPTRAILPHNYDKLLTNPVIGEDVVADDVNCLISLHDGQYTGLFDIVAAALQNGGVIDHSDWLLDSDDDPEFKFGDWDKFIHLLAVLETIFADDSL